MPLSFDSGGPTVEEVERLRLILSTYQDGSGMLIKNGKSLPGWRDFERSVAEVFDGVAVESKAIFDVEIPSDAPEYGISCKMRNTLRETRSSGRVNIELSNSSAKFADAFEEAGIDMAKDFRLRPDDAGRVILTTVAAWHQEKADLLDLDRSSFLSLSYTNGGDYQLHQFSMRLPSPNNIAWSFPDVFVKGVPRPGKRLQGEIAGVKLFEFYYKSGGQLKYYPPVTEAVWKSEPFQLESLAAVTNIYGAMEKAASYFPEKWQAVKRK